MVMSFPPIVISSEKVEKPVSRFAQLLLLYVTHRTDLAQACQSTTMAG